MIFSHQLFWTQLCSYQGRRLSCRALFPWPSPFHWSSSSLRSPCWPLLWVLAFSSRSFVLVCFLILIASFQERVAAFHLRYFRIFKLKKNLICREAKLRALSFESCPWLRTWWISSVFFSALIFCILTHWHLLRGFIYLIFNKLRSEKLSPAPGYSVVVAETFLDTVFSQIPGNFSPKNFGFNYFFSKYLKFPALFSEMALLNIAGNSRKNDIQFIYILLL